MSFFLAVLFLNATAHAAPQSTGSLSLEQFLSQVRGENKAVQSYDKTQQAAELRSEEGDLLTAPVFFSQVSHTMDKRPTTFTAAQGTRTDSNSFSVGVSKNYSFGLNTKIYYLMSNVDIQGATFLPRSKFTTASPVIELSQSIWKNGFGSEIKASQETVEAAAMATHHAEAAKLENQLVMAEMAYWRLAAARKSVQIQQASLERAEKILGWAQSRTRRNLGDSSDFLQAQAAYKARDLEFQLASAEERSARVGFNAARQKEGDAVPETLVEFSSEWLGKIAATQKQRDRSDVKAAEFSSKAVAGNARLNREKNTPQLDAFGTVSLNSLESTTGTAFKNSFSGNHPYYTVGLRLSVPLDIGVQNRTRAAYEMEQLAAETQYERKKFEQDQEWNDLSVRFQEVKRRLDLASQVKDTQREKLEYERTRLNRGRTTTYQVLMFEMDYALSELNLLRIQVEFIQLITQMKLYGAMS